MTRTAEDEKGDEDPGRTRPPLESPQMSRAIRCALGTGAHGRAAKRPCSRQFCRDRAAARRQQRAAICAARGSVQYRSRDVSDPGRGPRTRSGPRPGGVAHVPAACQSNRIGGDSRPRNSAESREMSSHASGQTSHARQPTCAAHFPPRIARTTRRCSRTQRSSASRRITSSISVIDSVLAQDKEFVAWRAEHLESYVPAIASQPKRKKRAARRSDPPPHPGPVDAAIAASEGVSSCRGEFSKRAR